MFQVMTESRTKYLTSEFTKFYAARKPNGEIWHLWTDSEGQHHMQHVECPGDDWEVYKEKHSPAVDPVTTICLQAHVNSMDIPFVVCKSIAARNMDKTVLIIRDNETIHVRSLGFSPGYTLQNAKTFVFDRANENRFLLSACLRPRLIFSTRNDYVIQP